MHEEALSTPFVSVIVPVYRDWVRLEHCVHALERQTYPSSAYEVLLVNNSPDEYKSLSLKGNFHLLSHPRGGSYAARNAGVAQAKGEILGFTDADCIPSETWIEEAVLFLRLHPQYSALGGQIQVFAASESPNVFEIYDMLTSFPQNYYVEERKFSVTANMFAYRSVFDRAGVFDARFTSGGDTEWGQRVSKMSYSLGYAQAVVVRHPARASLKSHIAKRRRIAHGKRMLEGESRLPMLVRLAVFIYQLRPPLRVAKRVFGDSRWSLAQQVRVIALAYYLKVVYEFERLKLSFAADE